jgi:hypothetical protein
MIEKFREIFDGLRSAYGITTKTGEIRPRDGKHETKNSIIRSEPTIELYQKHLDGEEPALGIIPINEDNLCRWGCVDIDEYNLDHKQIINKTKDLPTTLFRSKSGGGHLFIFTNEWVPASLMRTKLKMVAAFIGKSGSEIIPKQDVKRSDKSVGSYLNLPYHGGTRTVRYAFNENAEAMSLEEFLRLYDFRSLTKEQLENFNIEIKKKESNDDFEGIPPCLKTLLSNKVQEGGRNDVLFHLGVYLKKRFDKNWKTKMLLYNQKYFDPPLADDEVITCSNSVEKEDYLYKCKQEPMHSHCDPIACAMVKFGVGDGELPGIAPGSIEKYESDPPIYVVSIDGDQVECDDETLWNPDKFGMACMNQTQKIMDPVSKLQWRKLLKKLFQDIQDIPAPESSKLDVQMKDLFERFATRAPGKDISDVRKGKPFSENGTTIFKWTDYWTFLNRNGWDSRRMTSIKTQKMFIDIYNGREKSPKIDNKTTRVIEIDEQKIHEPIVRENKKKKASFQVVLGGKS